MSPDIRETLNRAAAEPSAASRMQEALLRGRRLRRRRMAAAGLLCAGVLVAAFTTFTLLPNGATDGDPSNARRECRAAEEQETHSGAYGKIKMTRLTPVVAIAQGEQKGTRWLFCAYMSSIKKNRGAPQESLCIEFGFGPGPGSGYGCSNLGAERPNGADYFYRAAGPPDLEEGTPYYGAISDRVDAIELVLRDGEIIDVTRYSPPRALQVDYDFFVGFTPPSVDVTVKVLDYRGKVLEREVWDALPVISAKKRGTGQGRVEAYSPDMLKAWKRGQAPHKPTKRWLDCGADCSGSVDEGVAVTFIATPEEGSTFAEWSGACTGSSPQCRLRVREATEVIARFEKEP